MELIRREISHNSCHFLGTAVMEGKEKHENVSGYKNLGYTSKRVDGRFIDWCLYSLSDFDKEFISKFPLPAKWEIFRSYSGGGNHWGFIAVSTVSGAIKHLEDFIWDDSVPYEYAWSKACKTLCSVLYTN
jgi:hypothetical protein